MANEYKFNIFNQSFVKGGVSVQGPVGSFGITVAGNNYVRYTYTATTSDTTLNLGGIGTIGWVYLFNTDATNYVQAGDGTSYNIKMLPGYPAGPMPWNAAAVHVKANTASCKIEVFIVEA